MRMRLWAVTDYTGAASVHYAVDSDHAIQKHLAHFGLLGLGGAVSAEPTNNARPCLDSYCNSVPPVYLEETCEDCTKAHPRWAICLKTLKKVTRTQAACEDFDRCNEE